MSELQGLPAPQIKALQAQASATMLMQILTTLNDSGCLVEIANNDDATGVTIKIASLKISPAGFGGIKFEVA